MRMAVGRRRSYLSSRLCELRSYQEQGVRCIRMALNRRLGGMKFPSESVMFAVHSFPMNR